MEMFSEKRGSWLWSVSVNPIYGKVTCRGEREKNGKKFVAVEISVSPAEATGMGSLSDFGLASVVGILGGSKLKKAWKAGVAKIRGK